MLPAFSDHHRSFPLLDGTLAVHPNGGRNAFRFLRPLLFHLARMVAAVAALFRWRGNRWVRVYRLQQGQRLDLGDPTVRDSLTSVKLAVLQGWLFRAPGALARHEDEVRRILSPDATVQAEARSLVEVARGDGDVLIGVHIRQGDYRRHLGGRFYFPTDAYVHVMERIRDLLKGEVRFLVATDTPQDWALFAHLPYTRSNGAPLQDLFGLAACDYLCGPPSSFTLWASFYGATPLAMLVSPEQDLTLDDFCVAPEIRDPAVADLY